MTLFDEVLAASQVTPNIFLMGDFNAKLGTLGEVADDQLHLLHAFPCLQNRRMSEFSDVNCAGTFLADLAMAAGLLICTGRTPGDKGQATYFLRRQDKCTPCSRPDHIILSPSLFGALQHCTINPMVPPFDHASISADFQVTREMLPNIDWHTPRHVCKPGGCGERLT